MPKSQYMQSNFASGELSPLLYGRTDLDQYYTGAQQAENVLVVPQGGLKRRPGNESLGKAVSGGTRSTVIPTMPSGGDRTVINDGDPLTTTQTDVIATSEAVIAQYDLGTERPEVVFIDILNARWTDAPWVYGSDLSIQYSQGGVSWDTLAVIDEEVFYTNGSAGKNFRVYSGVKARYWRIYKAAGPNVNRFELGEFNVGLTTITSGAFTITSWVANPKLTEFNVSDTNKYALSFTHENLRIYRVKHISTNNFGESSVVETETIIDIKTPYGFTSSFLQEWPQVRIASTENVMLLFHENYPVKRLTRLSENDWQLDDAPLFNIPQYDYDDRFSPPIASAIQTLTFTDFDVGENYQVSVNGVISKDIVFAGDSTSAEQLSTAANLQKNLQDMPTFGFSGISVARTGTLEYTVTMAEDSAGEYKLFVGFATSGDADASIACSITQQGASRSEDAWSAQRGYPKTGVFYQGRLWIGSTKSRLQSLFASRAGAFFDFFYERGEDDEGIAVTIDSKSSTRIIDLNPDRGLQIFTSGAEFILEGNTPSDVTVKAQTQYGSADIEPVSTDGATLFLDSNNKTLRQYLYNFNEDAYTSNDLSVLSSHLLKSPVDFCMLNGSVTEDSNWLFVVNADGSAAVLNTLRSQDINGWTKFIHADGAIRNCTAVGDYILTSVERDGVTYIEQWDFERMLDSSVKVEGTLSDGVIDGLSHLEGKTVTVIKEEIYDPSNPLTPGPSSRTHLPSRVVSAGKITLTPSEMGKQYEVGLPFNVAVKTMAINTNSGTRSGQNVMHEKKIIRMNVRFYESSSVYIDGNPVPIRHMGPEETNSLNVLITPVSGIVQDNNGGQGWDVDVSPLITSPLSMPFQIQAIEYEVESS
mgnify:CR=1 FL=1